MCVGRISCMSSCKQAQHEGSKPALQSCLKDCTRMACQLGSAGSVVACLLCSATASVGLVQPPIKLGVTGCACCGCVASGKWGYYALGAYGSLAMAIFMVKTMKRVIFQETRAYGESLVWDSPAAGCICFTLVSGGPLCLMALFLQIGGAAAKSVIVAGHCYTCLPLLAVMSALPCF